MRITYGPRNLAGAERILVERGVASETDVRQRIEENTILRSSWTESLQKAFVILHADMGLFRDVVNARDAAEIERFILQKDGADPTTGDALHVTYRIHADVTRSGSFGRFADRRPVSNAGAPRDCDAPALPCGHGTALLRLRPRGAACARNVAALALLVQ